MAETMIEIPLSKLHDSPFQRRTEYKGIEELGESMKELGVLQSLLARPHPKKKGHYELAAGHRRKRGAEHAGLEAVPVIVRELTDQEVNEALLIENGQRQDVPPLEELLTYKELRKQGLENADIAARIGRSESYVARRLGLDRLSEVAIEALSEGAITIGVAEVIAGVKSHEDQDSIVREAKATPHFRGMSVSEVKSYIEQDILMDLGNVLWNIDDAGLLPEAGACSNCTKNTGVATLLFPDMAEARCTDRGCFQRKRDAWWDRYKDTAAEQGLEVLNDEEAAKVFSHYGVSGGYIDLSRTVHEGYDHKNKRAKSRPLHEVLGDRIEGMPRAVARHPRTGEVYQLAKRKAVRTFLKGKIKKTDPWEVTSLVPSGNSQKASEKAAAEEMNEVRFRLSAAVGEACMTEPFEGGPLLWRMLVRELTRMGQNDSIRNELPRWNIAMKKSKRAYSDGEFIDVYGTLFDWMEGKLEFDRPWERTRLEPGEKKSDLPAPALKGEPAVGELQAFYWSIIVQNRMHYGVGLDALKDYEEVFGFSLKDIKRDAKAYVKSFTKHRAAVKRERDQKAKARLKKVLAKHPCRAVVCPVCFSEVGKPCRDPETKKSLGSAHHEGRITLADGGKPNGKASDINGEPPKPPKTKNEKRDPAVMAARHDAGESYAKIGKDVGLSKDQVARRIKAHRAEASA